MEKTKIAVAAIVHSMVTWAFVFVLLKPISSHALEDILLSKPLVPGNIVWDLTAESLRLPASKKMGMVAGNLLFGVSDKVRLGVGTYGAISGERGGFITLGIAGELLQSLGNSWSSHAGLFAGAGGGHGGRLLAGGGMMLRAGVGFSYEKSGYGDFGFGISHIRFPTGAIASTQPYIQYQHAFYTVLSPGWLSYASDTDASAEHIVRADANEISVVARHYTIPDSALGNIGQLQQNRMQLLGVEWLTYPTKNWFIKLESEGAIGGESKGYMQILAGGGYRLPLSSSTVLKFAAAAGPAGGGGVDTGGGLLLDAGMSLQQKIATRTALEFSVSQLRAPSSNFRAQSVAVKVNYHFGVPVVSSSAIPWGAMRSFDAQKFRLRAVNQTYFSADYRWRNQYAGNAVSTLGVQADYFVSPTFFVTGQGLAAYAGEAGAYMTGQLGVGRRWSAAEHWFVEGEGLLGAAGGGGMEVGGGLIAQANASLGYHMTDYLSLLGTAGRIQAMQGKFKANVIGVSLAYQFTAFAR